MTSRDFCYWLQGFFEIGAQSPFAGTPNAQGLGEHQVECIRRHLALVFKHEIDPSAGPPEHQAKLDEIHNGPKPLQPGASTVGVGIGPNGLIYRC